MVSRVIGTAMGSASSCQPEAVSPVNSTSASSWPVPDQRCPTCVPVLFCCL